MDEGKSGSLLADGRDEFTGGFHPLLLWRDRQRILARPDITVQPHPPLANAPLRFALTLSLTPLLVIAWLASSMVSLLPGERSERGGIEYPSATVIEALQSQLPQLGPAQLDELRRSVPRSARAPEASAFAQEASRIAFFQPSLEPAERRAELRAWAQRVRASSLPRVQQDAVLAEILDSAHDLRRIDSLLGGVSRNLSEGGPLMQFLSIVSLISSTWLFGQMVRGDARFPAAARGEALYLYYTTSRLFWFVPAQALAYGMVSYASASDDAALLRSAQVLSMTVGVASLLYVLAGSREMARALGGGTEAPRGGAWAIGWRMLVAMTVTTIVLGFCFFVLGIVVGFVRAMLG
jgi:hypothetical protein